MVKMESQQSPTCQAAVFFVSDVVASKRFYNKVLGQRIVADFGRNVIFEGGLSIWEKNYALGTIFGKKAVKFIAGANNAEIYFESSKIDKLFGRLTKNDVAVIHPVQEHPWGQKAFPIYDPDRHIIEFAEPMSAVVLRLHNNGLSLAEITEKSMMPQEFIKVVLQIQ